MLLKSFRETKFWESCCKYDGVRPFLHVCSSNWNICKVSEITDGYVQLSLSDCKPHDQFIWNSDDHVFVLYLVVSGMFILDEDSEYQSSSLSVGGNTTSSSVTPITVIHNKLHLPLCPLATAGEEPDLFLLSSDELSWG